MRLPAQADSVPSLMVTVLPTGQTQERGGEEEERRSWVIQEWDQRSRTCSGFYVQYPVLFRKLHSIFRTTFIMGFGRSTCYCNLKFSLKKKVTCSFSDKLPLSLLLVCQRFCLSRNTLHHCSHVSDEHFCLPFFRVNRTPRTESDEQQTLRARSRKIGPTRNPCLTAVTPQETKTWAMRQTLMITIRSVGSFVSRHLCVQSFPVTEDCKQRFAGQKRQPFLKTLV